MARLSEAEKREIVRLLAHFVKPSQVVATFRADYGVEIDRFQVRAYDPTNPRFEAGERWRETFEAERAAYLHSIESVPISHKGFRLGMLQRLLEKAEASGNLVLACAILAQAAKEVGDGFSNRRRLEIDPARSSFDDLTSEERRERVADMFREVLNVPEPVRRAA